MYIGKQLGLGPRGAKVRGYVLTLIACNANVGPCWAPCRVPVALRRRSCEDVLGCARWHGSCVMTFRVGGVVAAVKTLAHGSG